MIADLRTAEGGFASALDADSEGEEGAFYVWTPAELADVLGEEDGAYAAELFAVAPSGTFEHGRSVLAASGRSGRPGRVTSGSGRRCWRPGPARVWPGRDDKVVAAWNGLAIAALAEAGLLFGRHGLRRCGPRRRRAARGRAPGRRPAGQDIDERRGWAQRRRPRGLRQCRGRAARAGRRDGRGDAGWELPGICWTPRCERFREARRRLLRHRRRQRAADLPPCRSGRRSDAVRNLRGGGRAAELRGADRIGHASRGGGRGARRGSDVAAKYPQAAGWGLAVAEAFLAGPDEIAIVGPPRRRRGPRHCTGRPRSVPRRAPCSPSARPTGSEPEAGIPLLAGRGLVNGKPAAYVCRDFTCRLPVTTSEELLALLRP